MATINFDGQEEIALIRRCCQAQCSMASHERYITQHIVTGQAMIRGRYITHFESNEEPQADELAYRCLLSS